jgi:hypothetical protein
MGNISAVEHDAPGRRFMETRDQPRQGGLAAAGLADKADGLATHDPQIHAIDRTRRCCMDRRLVSWAWLG